MLENKETVVLKTTKEIVNELEITLQEVLDTEDNTKKFYYSVNNIEDNAGLSWENYLGSKLSAIEVYHALTSERRFYLNDELILSYTIFNSEKGAEESTREEEASKRGVPTSDILVTIHKNEIYRHEVISE